MEKYVNEWGKTIYTGVEESTPFDFDLFTEVDMSKQNSHCSYDYERDYQRAFHSNLGSLTVLDRMTGFGWRDVESGFRDKDGKLWIASGGKDIRYAEVKTFGEAIEWIKENANTCIGV